MISGHGGCLFFCGIALGTEKRVLTEHFSTSPDSYTQRDGRKVTMIITAKTITSTYFPCFFPMCLCAETPLMRTRLVSPRMVFCLIRHHILEATMKIRCSCETCWENIPTKRFFTRGQSMSMLWKYVNSASSIFKWSHLCCGGLRNSYSCLGRQWVGVKNTW